MKHAYPQKDRMVKVYFQKPVNWRNEHARGTFLEKHYIHPKGAYLRAHIRQIVAENKTTEAGVTPADRFLIVINWRELKKGQYYIEWGKRTFKVLNIDGYEWRGLELKFETQEIDSDATIYKRVSEEKWK